MELLAHASTTLTNKTSSTLNGTMVVLVRDEAQVSVWALG